VSNASLAAAQISAEHKWEGRPSTRSRWKCGLLFGALTLSCGSVGEGLPPDKREEWVGAYSRVDIVGGTVAVARWILADDGAWQFERHICGVDSAEFQSGSWDVESDGAVLVNVDGQPETNFGFGAAAEHRLVATPDGASLEKSLGATWELVVEVERASLCLSQECQATSEAVPCPVE
jgi:hypothetical protein